MRDYTLKSWTRTPPGGWVYKHPITGLVISCSDSTVLLQKVQSHRVYKRLERVDMDQVAHDVEQQIIERIKQDQNYVTHKKVVHG